MQTVGPTLAYEQADRNKVADQLANQPCEKPTMTQSFATRIATLALSAAIAAPALMFSAPVAAKEGTSLGKGVKCYWVLVSSVGANNTYKQVCRKGI